MLVAQVMNFAAVKGHTELALKAWECMEYAILPAAPFPSGKLRLRLSVVWQRPSQGCCSNAPFWRTMADCRDSNAAHPGISLSS